MYSRSLDSQVKEIHIKGKYVSRQRLSRFELMKPPGRYRIDGVRFNTKRFKIDLEGPRSPGDPDDLVVRLAQRLILPRPEGDQRFHRREMKEKTQVVGKNSRLYLRF